MKKFRKTKHSEKAFIEPEKRGKRLSWPTIFTIIAILIMVASGIGFIWEGGNAFVYNNLKFKESGNKYVTKIEGKRLDFYTNPFQAESINASKEAIWVLKNTRMAYMTSEAESRFKDSIALVQYNLKQDLEKEGIYAVYAFTGKNEFNVTEVGCKNATLAVPVIYFTNSTESEIKYGDGCIILGSFSEFGFATLKDRLMYGFYGIIE